MMQFMCNFGVVLISAIGDAKYWKTVTDSLNLLWKGMLAMAIVMVIIFLLVLLVRVLTNGADAAKKRKKEEAEKAAQDAANQIPPVL